MDAMQKLEELKTREDLVRAVELGRMTIEEADDRALSIGLGPLLPSHPADAFDPMAQDRWSLLMGVVWVLTRNRGAVLNSWNAYITTQYQFAREGFIGPYRAGRKPQKWLYQIPHTMSGEHMFNDAPGRSFSLSLTLLKLAIANGQVRTWARDLRQGELADVAEIPAANWNSLSIGRISTARPLPHLPPLPTLHDEAEDMLHFGNGVPVYVGVLMDRAMVVRAFPGDDTDGVIDGKSSPLDPVKQITDAMPVEETKPARKKRIRMEAIRAAFPTGVPATMAAKERDRLLEAQVKLIDKSMDAYSERSWTRLCEEVAQKD